MTQPDSPRGEVKSDGQILFESVPWHNEPWAFASSLTRSMYEQIAADFLIARAALKATDRSDG